MKNDYGKRLERAYKAVQNAEYILIGAGAGLSASAGLSYSGERFEKQFADFIKKYGVEDMYSATFYPYKTQEELWAYWARHIAANRWDVPALPLYKELLKLIQDRDYFVITTNVDAQFEKAGFSMERFFAIQGDYGFFQCAKGCHSKLYRNEAAVREMIENAVDLKIPSSLVPKCPICGGDMSVHVRKDEYFVENEVWRQNHTRYSDYIKKVLDKKLVLLELGVGYNTPGIIRFPFEQITYQNVDATLVRFNRDYPNGAKENIRRTVAFTEDIAPAIRTLLRCEGGHPYGTGKTS